VKGSDRGRRGRHTTGREVASTKGRPVKGSDHGGVSQDGRVRAASTKGRPVKGSDLGRQGG